MNFAYVIVYVPDVAAALDFYERAFDLRRRSLHESGEYGELETGATVLAFASLGMAVANGLDLREPRPDRPPAGMELVFASPDVTAAFRRAVGAGAVPVQAPADKPWGQTVAYVRDPRGVLIELCTPLG